ncbi:unnamed protein product [Thelazia callipaeda]|uniref:phenylalanine--tRNA ligase n=1 Tax=Thelazia callipaeda TaxID=103827 RepID=A0A0N5CMW2_THECL|nr:unnamed protein product [Thelazia callipaeda]
MISIKLKLLCSSGRSVTFWSRGIHKPKIVPPETFHIDGESFLPDEKWNLSPAVIQKLQRRLLFESGNPLCLLKKRIVDYIYGKYRVKGGNSPQFTVIDNQSRVVSVFDNFDSLLVPIDHVSRSTLDTYYINKDYCLRSHTSAHQHSLIKQGLDSFLVIGDVYRRDAIDRTHFSCFHQVEGVRLFTAAELFNDPLNPNQKPLFINGSRTSEKQELHTENAAECLVKDLKENLEDLCRIIFNFECDMRWVGADFPFTYPSFELEVYYENRWMEVLGCGIIEQDLLKIAGVVDRVGWAFGLGLERLAMILYGIPDIRLFWSRDSGFLSQFTGKSSTENFKYVPVSVHPQVLYDLSFWLPDGMSPDEMNAETCDLIRSTDDSLIEQANDCHFTFSYSHYNLKSTENVRFQVKMIDTFLHPKTKKISQTYRLVYRSHDKALTKEEVNRIHFKIRQKMVENYGVMLR